VRNDRLAWSGASGPVHTASTDNGVSFRHERNAYPEERHGGRGRGHYVTDRKVFLLEEASADHAR
jgi:hypothetical protein